MDLGSDVSSRSSSESNSNKVTPCSPSLDLATLEDYKSSPSLDLVTLEDYEEDEDFQDYKKKVIEEWESEYGEDYTSPQPPGSEEADGGTGGMESPEDGGGDGDGDGYGKTVNSRSLAEEFQEVKTAPPLPAPGGHTALSVAASPDELKQNGNLILPTNRVRSPGTLKEGTGTRKANNRSSRPSRGSRGSSTGLGGGGGAGGRIGRYREEEAGEEEPLPTMDWAALERHLAGLQCREQENQNLNQNQNHNMGKSNYTSVSRLMVHLTGRLSSVHPLLLFCYTLLQKLHIVCFVVPWRAAVIHWLSLSDGPWEYEGQVSWNKKGGLVN